jgi:colanic acid/amylovoran biosynthesis glycosyltransferase
LELKIAVLAGQFPKLSETFVIDQIVGLLKLGHDVRIFSLVPGEPVMQPEVSQYNLLSRSQYANHPPCGIAHRMLGSLGTLLRLLTYCPGRFPSLMQLAWPLNSRAQRKLRLASLLSECGCDLLHCHFGSNGTLAVETRDAINARYPVVTTFHGSDMNTNAVNRGYTELFEHGARFIANTKYTKRNLMRMGCPEDRIVVLPVGVNTDTARFAERELKTGEVPQLLSVARLVPFKGLSTAISAVAILRDRGIRVLYQIIGEGPLKNELQGQVAGCNLSEVVTFSGAMNRTDVLEQMHRSHALLLPSIESGGRTETQGLVLQEAQATGLPVIASRIGGIPEGVIDGKSGYLFPAGNAELLADCIARFLEESNRWPEMGRTGREMVLSRYDNLVLAKKMDQLFQDVLAEAK